MSRVRHTTARSLAQSTPRRQFTILGKRGGAGGGIALLLAGLVALGLTGDPYYSDVIILALFAIVLGVSYRLLLLTGEASFCHGAFYALGAYTTAILTTHLGWPFWPTMLAGGAVASLGAVVIGIPSLRTSGPYFFLVTFCFLIVVNSVLGNASSVTGGFSGIFGIGQPAGIVDITGFFFLALALAVASAAVFALVDHSRWGLELVALGGSPELAQSAGASRLGNMLMAFVVGAFFAGMTGSVYASYITFISPSSFSMWVSIYVLMYVVVGGSRYLAGAVIGAALLTLVPVALNWSEAYQGVFTSAMTLAVIVVARRGVVTAAVDGWHRFRQKTAAAAAATEADQTVAGESWERVAAFARANRAKDPETPSAVNGTLLEVRDLSKHFGGVRALDGVAMRVGPSETVGVIGPNGAGKTTFFNLISGFIQPSRGDVLLRGHSIVGVSPHRIARMGLTRTFQASVVFERLSVRDNVLVGCRPDSTNPFRRAFQPVRSPRAEVLRANELVDAFGLGQWANLEAGAIPYGARKILGVAIGMAAKPSLLCLDEPLAGLTGVEVERMCDLLASLGTSHGVALMLIEHRVPEVMRLCPRIVVLNFGRMIAEGNPEHIRGNPLVIEAYLGGEAVDDPLSA